MGAWLDYKKFAGSVAHEPGSGEGMHAMKSGREKLHSQNGETLVETLFAIMITVLSVSLLYGGIMVSAKINERARQVDDVYYHALAQAEEKSGLTPADPQAARQITVTVQTESGAYREASVRVFGAEGLYSYKKSDSASPLEP